MRSKQIAAVANFQKKFEAQLSEKNTPLHSIPKERIALNKRIILEEINETDIAIRADSIVEIADGCADILYTVYHGINQLGRDLDAGRKAAAVEAMLEAYRVIETALGAGSAVSNLSQIDCAFAYSEILVRGVAAVYDIPVDEVFMEVHRSNMTKLWDGKVKKDEGGKIMKPPTYSKADVKSVLDAHNKKKR